MPQMMPLTWLILFIYFIIIFFLLNCMNYYSFLYKNKTFKINKNIIKLNWKW